MLQSLFETLYQTTTSWTFLFYDMMIFYPPILWYDDILPSYSMIWWYSTVLFYDMMLFYPHILWYDDILPSYSMILWYSTLLFYDMMIFYPHILWYDDILPSYSMIWWYSTVLFYDMMIFTILPSLAYAGLKLTKCIANMETCRQTFLYTILSRPTSTKNNIWATTHCNYVKII